MSLHKVNNDTTSFYCIYIYCLKVTLSLKFLFYFNFSACPVSAGVDQNHMYARRKTVYTD